MTKLYLKLLEIQATVDRLYKDSKGQNYRYVSGSSVLSEIRPLMVANKLLLKQEAKNPQLVRHDYKTYNGEKTSVLFSCDIIFTWIDCESGEKEVCEFLGVGFNDWDKGFGSALTYSERYFLLKFFHIPTDDEDVDKPKEHPKEQPKKENIPSPPNDFMIFFKKEMDSYKTLDEINLFFVNNVAKLSIAEKKMLSQRADEIGLIFDKQTNKFINK